MAFVGRSDVGMILADSRYAGQLNVPDIFTRLLFSLVTTGVAPRSFYRDSADQEGGRPHYEGLPVDFLADAIAAIGPQHGSSFDTYNTTNPHDDGISLDTFVDWIIAAGFPVEKIDDYSTCSLGSRRRCARSRRISVATRY